MCLSYYLLQETNWTSTDLQRKCVWVFRIDAFTQTRFITKWLIRHVRTHSWTRSALALWREDAWWRQQRADLHWLGLNMDRKGRVLSSENRFFRICSACTCLITFAYLHGLFTTVSCQWLACVFGCLQTYWPTVALEEPECSCISYCKKKS